MNRAKLLRKLTDRSFRRAFTEEAVDVGIPIQIREMRRARRWTQQQLGDAASIAQEAVARAESLTYGRFTLATLKNLAAAFDCALIVRFAPFSELIDWKERIDSATVTPADFSTDAALHRSPSRSDIEVVLIGDLKTELPHKGLPASKRLLFRSQEPIVQPNQTLLGSLGRGVGNA
jgi:transcriptional regulator with XRE-family HTH domain